MSLPIEDVVVVPADLDLVDLSEAEERGLLDWRPSAEEALRMKESGLENRFSRFISIAIVRIKLYHKYNLRI